MAADKANPPPASSSDETGTNENTPHQIQPDKHTARFPIIGIGASAGGLDAFKRFFSAMPSDSGMAFILVPHLDPSHRSLMVELLTRECEMNVCEVKDGMTIEQDRIYIIPPNKELSVSKGRLGLSDCAERQVFSTVLNGFFRSLAADQQEMAIGIVLSGTGSHGAPGLKEIKSVGGMVMAQDPGTAEYDQMPRSAIDTGLVDYVLPPEKMPEALSNYVRQPYLGLNKMRPAEDAGAEQISPVLDLLRMSSCNDFRCYRKSMLVRRIQRRMAICQIDAVSDYLVYLHEHAQEIPLLCRDLLIGVTSFFRDPDAFQALQLNVIPDLVDRQKGETPVRVWVPACATGEEAYSIAILFLEEFAAREKPPNIKIFASDIDDESLETARRGMYSASILGELSAERVQRYFLKTDGSHYQVTKQLRGCIVVNRQNVISDPPFSKLDLISCRNLLIYMKPELQQKIISLFHFSLNDPGYLFLGCSESIGQHTDLFESISKKWSVCRRIGPTRHDLVQIPILSDDARRSRSSRCEPIRRPRMGFAELTQRLLFERFAPAAVLINRKYEVLSLSGRTTDYLEMPTGELTRDLMTLLRQGLRTKLRAACHEVLNGNNPTAVMDARVLRNGTSVACSLTVNLLQEPKEVDGLLLITFHDQVEAIQPVGNEILMTEDESATVRQLELEVETTRADLQSMIEDQQSSNEEVMSMNEELQSANEELETSQEELQSLNEEMSTMNSQLQDKVEELEQANNDFHNLLTSTEIATMFLDMDLRIRRFTPFTAELLHLIESDIGRSILDFALKFTDHSLLQDIKLVMDHKASVEADIRSDDGRFYLRRIHPYFISGNYIGGVVLTFVEITGRVQAEARSRRLAAVLRDSNDAVILLDRKGRITSWNRGAEQMYGYSEVEALQLSLRDLFPADEHERQELLLQRIAQTDDIESFEVRQVTKEGKVLDIWSTVTRLASDRGDEVMIAVTSRDMTARKQVEAALFESERRIRAIVDTAADAIITINERGTIDRFNPAAERMFGYSRDEAIGQNIRILMPQPYRDEHDECLARYMETGKARVIGVGRELIGQRKDGSTFPIDLAVSEHGDGNSRLFTGIVRDLSERKLVQRELLAVVSEEHRRIGQDLHDSVGQKLTGLGMIAGSLEKTLEQNSPSDAKVAHRITTGLEDALSQVRLLSKGLIPVEIDAEGLRAALTDLAETCTVDSGIKCDVDSAPDVRVTDNDAANHLYRIAQEAVANALKHAHPNHIHISLAGDDTQTILSVRDDGRGISPPTSPAVGIGLKTMEYRANLIGATLSISPIKKGGTLVTCRLSVSQKHGKPDKFDE